MTRTDLQLAGDSAEVLVAQLLAARGWRILARNVHAGRSELDIVATDPGPPPRLVVHTEGADGGLLEPGGHYDAVDPPGPIVDSYGCGDCFAAGLTYGLAAGMPVAEAVKLAARCGATVLTGNGPYERQLTLTG